MYIHAYIFGPKSEITCPGTNILESIDSQFGFGFVFLPLNLSLQLSIMSGTQKELNKYFLSEC